MSACSIRPEWQRLADAQGIESGWIDTVDFRHLVIANSHPGNHLRVYIEGDGVPWIREQRVAIDPTPANPVLLRLMVADDGAAIYLGRPCYFGTSTSQACRPALWTSERYARPVIRSMCEAANSVSSARGARSVELVGYSGGGAIAVAMRDCTRRLFSITTIAGNLDVSAWTKHHGYTPLVSSRQLESRADAPANVREIHWQCRDDGVIPPAVTDEYFKARPMATRIVVDECTHAEGWERYRSRITAAGTSGKPAG